MSKIKIFLFAIILFLTIGFWGPNGIDPIGRNACAGEILETGTKLYSQNNEELIIRDYFNDRRGGVFVDVGCNHYQFSNTTYYLEKNLGWSGIAIDALAECGLGYIENRPNTRFFSFLVTNHSGDIKPFYRVTGETGLSSTSIDIAKEHMDMFKVSEKYQLIYVPTITLTDLLEKNGISKIDLLSMDIEGGEKEALDGFDIEKFRPELVCIEGHPEYLDYFSKHHYEIIEEYKKYDQSNWYFRPKK